MAFNDILFDAKKLVKLISPASWGQGFENGRGAGISFDRVIDCLKEAKVKADPAEGHIQQPSLQILINLFLLTKDHTPLCKSGADIRARLSDVIEENTRNFSHGEKVLLETLGNLADDDHKLRFYIVFQRELDRLLVLAARKSPLDKKIME